MKHPVHLLTIGMVVLLMLSTCGCLDEGDEEIEEETGIKEQTINAILDSFSYSGNFEGYNKIEIHDWSCSKSGASITVQGTIGSGSYRLSIHDKTGSRIFKESFDNSGAHQFQGSTEEGDAGSWQVKLEFLGFTGSIQISIDAKTIVPPDNNGSDSPDDGSDDGIGGPDDGDSGIPDDGNQTGGGDSPDDGNQTEGGGDIPDNGNQTSGGDQPTPSDMEAVNETMPIISGWLSSPASSSSGETTHVENIDLNRSKVISITIRIHVEDSDATHEETDNGSNPDTINSTVEAKGYNGTLEVETPGDMIFKFKENTYLPQEWNVTIKGVEFGSGKPAYLFRPGLVVGGSPLVYVDQGAYFEINVEYTYLVPK